MKYLLDTHTFIWSLVEDQKLSAQVKSIIENVDDTNVSIISLWEISLKFGLGKLELKGSNPEKLWEDSKKMNYKFLPLDFDEVVSSYNLPREHNDPFDRMLVWQSIKNNLTLVSNDIRLDVYKKLGLKIIR